ncbi:hypothetical protein MIZ01_2409 [Sideroxyarcus emersonii]|uniref:Uncharacterized protein n=1 Tax=Sideroxyarcus emersonii TaxID=2764705 RepID=A0AAN1XCE8_9PROT|nr:hypothetical protein [Sideroxyarcus emersonii]BCK88604.1 hypothetical protein MIZ01_2409 [Sideroxyarcus emersonii]
MVEILIFVVAAISGLFITGYAIHMLVGGLVSTDTEFQLIALVCFVVACGIAYMAWDVIKRRRIQRP